MLSTANRKKSVHRFPIDRIELKILHNVLTLPWSLNDRKPAAVGSRDERRNFARWLERRQTQAEGFPWPIVGPGWKSWVRITDNAQPLSTQALPHSGV